MTSSNVATNSNHYSRTRTSQVLISLETGPSRARYFPRDMLLLTTTARERAWCLAFTKNNWSADWLTWWGFPDSWGFPLVSAALLVYCVHHRSSAYIRAALSSSSKFEQSDGIDHRRRSPRCGVWKAACSTRTTRESKLLWRRRCFTSSMFLEPTCNAAFLFSCLWGPVNFFMKAMSIKPWTVEELGLSSQKLRTFRRNLLGADNETWSRWRFSKTWAQSILHAHLHGPRTTAGQRWFELPGRSQHLGKDASDGWFFSFFLFLLFYILGFWFYIYLNE